MEYTYNQLLGDDALRQHLHAGDTLIFRIEDLRWQELERQVERLGYEEEYLVTFRSSKHGESCRVCPRNQPVGWVSHALARGDSEERVAERGV